ncbi:MAG: MFS transporter [Agarilytica sp.]
MLKIQQQLTNSFYILLSLPATAMGFALSVQIAALSWILSTQYQLEIHDIGLVWAAGPLAGILGQVIIGLISDRVWFWGGRRRPFILIGGTLAALMLLMLPNIQVISSATGGTEILIIAIIVALSLDLAINVSFNPTRSIIADVTYTPKERAKGYTWMQTISGSFGVAAYFIGAVWGNYVLIYVGAGLVLALSILPAFFIVEPESVAEEDADSTYELHLSFVEMLLQIKPLWGFLIYSLYALVARIFHYETDSYTVEIVCTIITVSTIAQIFSTDTASFGASNFRKVLAAHAFTWIGVQAMFVYMFAFVQYSLPELGDVEMGRVVSISFLILSAVAAVLPVLVLRPMSESFGPLKTHCVCIASMAVGYLLLASIVTNVWVIYGLMALLGIGWASTISLPFAIMSVSVSKSQMGAYMGLFNLSVVLPQLIASLGVGPIVSAADNKSLIFVICGVSLGVSAVIWAFVHDSGSK